MKLALLKVWSKSSWFMVPYFIFVLLGAGIMLSFEKGADILYINALHTPDADSLFKVLTKSVEFPIIVVWMIIVGAFHFRHSLFVAASTVFAGLIAQALKHFVFTDMARPALFFQQKNDLNFVDGVEILHQHSFPSGHTAAAFSLCLALALTVQNKKIGALLFVTAVLVAVSRVYLLQHFFRDVYAGAAVGVFASIATYLVFTQLHLFSSEKEA